MHAIAANTKVNPFGSLAASNDTVSLKFLHLSFNKIALNHFIMVLLPTVKLQAVDRSTIQFRTFLAKGQST